MVGTEAHHQVIVERGRPVALITLATLSERASHRRGCRASGWPCTPHGSRRLIARAC
jgi:hypothetical protein